LDAELQGADASEIRRHLQLIADVRKTMIRPPGLRWSSPEEMLVEGGLAFGPGPSRPDLMGDTKACYSNAMRAVLSDPGRLVYCEGFAISGTVRLPVHHAWVMEIGSSPLAAVEVTWPQDWRKPKDDFLYLGVPVDPDFALKSLKSGGCLFWDHRAGYPMMSRDVPLEDWWHSEVPLPPAFLAADMDQAGVGSPRP